MTAEGSLLHFLLLTIVFSHVVAKVMVAIESCIVHVDGLQDMAGSNILVMVVVVGRLWHHFGFFVVYHDLSKYFITIHIRSNDST